MAYMMKIVPRKYVAALFVAACFTGRGYADGYTGEYLLKDSWRKLLAFYSPVSNPAFMTERNYVSVSAASALSLDGPSRLFETGVVVPVGLFQSAGITAVVENGKDIVGGYIEDDGRYVSGGTRMNTNNMFIMGSWAVNPWRALSLGLNASLARQGNFEEPITNFCIDAGLSYRLIHHPAAGEHVLGITYKNLLASKLQSGPGPAYPEQMRIILHSNYLEERLESLFEFDLTDIAAAAENFSNGEPATEWNMTILGGTWLLRLIKMHAFVEIHGNKDGGKMDAWGVAGGINAPVINNGRDCNIEYQFRDEINQSLMATHSLNVRFDVGRHREETYARKMSLLVNLLPGDLYNKALKLYHEGKFWDSYFVFGQLLVLFPDFFKNDMAMYYRGSCLEEMDMREHAISTYEQVKAKYPKSSTLPLVDLGIMRVAYRNNDALMVQGQYRLLSGDNVPDSITSHADYLVGQTMVGVGDSKQAIRMLTRIPESHPEYVFAMHSAGVAHILAMEFSEAMECFEKCLEAQIKTPAQKEIYHRSCLFLGYLFYREESLSKAVTALRMVPPESYYYEDALLGLGWCAAKSGKWGDCMTSGTLLAKASSKPVLKYEAALIKAYGLIMTKDYMAAKNELEPVIEPLKAMQLPTQDTLRAAKSRNALVKSTYGRIASEAEELSLVQESSETIKKTDSLHVHQQNLLGELDRFRKYENEFARLQIFGRDISRLRDDVEYALAVAEKHSAESGTEKVRDKLKEKTEDINQEIQKIQNEMEKIEGTE